MPVHNVVAENCPKVESALKVYSSVFLCVAHRPQYSTTAILSSSYTDIDWFPHN